MPIFPRKSLCHLWQEALPSVARGSAIRGTRSAICGRGQKSPIKLDKNRAICGRFGEILCDGHTRLKLASKPVILLVKTLFLKGISTRCGPCKI